MTMRWRKLLAVSTAVAMMSAMLTGCGSKSEEVATEPETTQETVEETAEPEAETVTDEIYEDANGWNVHYNPEVITVTTENNITTFVYTADCPGTCMVSFNYDLDMSAKEKSEALAKEYGETAKVSESIFPGTEDITGYWVSVGPEEGGPGLYTTAILRDYMEGYLLVENVSHVGGDEEQDMMISDSLATIIDSIQFVNYEN